MLLFTNQAIKKTLKNLQSRKQEAAGSRAKGRLQTHEKSK